MIIFKNSVLICYRFGMIPTLDSIFSASQLLHRFWIVHGHDDTWCNYPRQWNAGAVAENNFAKVYHPKSCGLKGLFGNCHPVSVYIEKSGIADNLSYEIDAIGSSGQRDEGASTI